jgi:pimeloyl-ACP methyl ester carboxylesterase
VAPLTPSGRARTPEGVGIAYYDLGGSGPDLILAHATGFCGAALGPTAARLTDRFRCVVFDERGHGSSDRPAREDFDWHGFGADVTAVVDHLGLDRPAGFGHSCGGAALLLAEEARPGTFSMLYCYEPIILPNDVTKPPNLDSNPLSAGARKRREVFPSREEALANFAGKAPFNVLDREVLVAYVDNGFGPDPEGIRLRCRRDDEAQVYAQGGAHDAFGHLGEVRCPVVLACGAHTDAIGPDYCRVLAGKMEKATVEVFDDLGHFGPLESPDEVARSLGSALSPSGDTPGA